MGSTYRWTRLLSEVLPPVYTLYTREQSPLDECRPNQRHRGRKGPTTMSTELLVGAAVITGVLVGRNRKVQDTITKAGSMLDGAWNAAGAAFQTPLEVQPVKVAQRK